ncbi:hypothetical protein [Runella aurantiaca]|uniref:Uncharacterized protein n=1 Tax=Runella aurantiaca TaxID=2282308 RepID=A0A369I8T7_9BACT|nr:hypothetical protein [Runella aurantiaca]RDB06169.1 hypothetical protein DVG78_10075 [Runella aurantiaca]
MEKLTILKNRYGDFCDSIIECLSYKLHYNNRIIEMTTLTRNIEFTDKNVYEIVKFRFTKIKEFKFYEEKGSVNYVVVLGGNFLKIENTYIFDFIPWGENLTTLGDIRKSDFYIICEEFDFEFKQYFDV